MKGWMKIQVCVVVVSCQQRFKKFVAESLKKKEKKNRKMILKHRI